MPVHEGTGSAVTRGAVAVIVNADGLVLMHLRDDVQGVAWRGHWSLLGGGSEPGESPDQTVVRELREEAGLVVADLRAVLEIADAADPAGCRSTNPPQLYNSALHPALQVVGYLRAAPHMVGPVRW